MVDQLPIISGTYAINTRTTTSTSLIGRGLSAILNQETGLAKSDLDARYRQARDIYNRISNYNENLEVPFNPDTLLNQGKQIDLFEDNPLPPFFTMPQQLANVFTVFQQLADKNYGKAYFPLSIMYWGEQGISKNIDKAKYYTRMAFDWCFSNQGLSDPLIWVDLGWMYANDHGVEQDINQAVFWFRKAANKDNALAQYHLGWMYANDHGVEQDINQAVFWFRKAANKDNALAQYHLGWMYEVGCGVEQDDEQAVIWYRKAAEQGCAPAQLSLGRMYKVGFGVEQDDEQAVFWYSEAAEQGYANAQCNLGWMYEYGRGVEQDDEQAVFWYSEAAEQGYAPAQKNLTNRGINWKNK